MSRISSILFAKIIKALLYTKNFFSNICRLLSNKKGGDDFFAKPFLLQRQVYGEQTNKTGRYFLEKKNG
jgi:hypothetical protein